MGKHPIREKRHRIHANEIADAIWRTTPGTLRGRVLGEAITRREEWFDLGTTCQSSSAVTEAPHILTGQRAYEEYHAEDLVADWGAHDGLNWTYGDDFFTHRAGEHAEALWKVHEQSQGLGKIDALLSGLVSRTQAIYRRAWRRWLLFCAGGGRQPRLGVSQLGWDEAVLEFIMHEHRVLGLNPRSIRCKLPGI